MNPLIELKEFGQSIWYDNIRRDLITSGELTRMMEDCGVTGMTSNPVIFEKAISGGEEYDPDIKRFIREGLSTGEILTRLFTDDIRMAADTLRPIFDETGGDDGYVSIEVRPELAHDRDGTIEEAEHLFKIVDRPNVMVKVPATKEGVGAIEELVYRGHNINVTLLFSVKRYREVAEAYVRALTRRADEGKPVDGILGVASFFVSRVDTLVDDMIDEMASRAENNDQKARLTELKGKVAVANAKLAYKKCTEVFGSPEWSRLADLGATAQKLLWGSTSTKNPQYSDVKYVEELIGKNTINTMPLNTINSFRDHGKVADTLPEGLEEAEKTIEALSDAGISYDEVTETLEAQGIEGFEKGYDSLVEVVTEKIEEAAAGGPSPAEYSLGEYQKTVDGVLEWFDKERFSERLWAKDPTLWKKAPAQAETIKNALGWLSLPIVMNSHVEHIKTFADEVRGGGFKDVVLLGMGGSSLAPLVMAETFGPVEGYPRLRVLDTTDPDAVRRTTGEINPESTLFIVASKSGSTLEPLSLFEYYWSLLSERFGEEAGKNFIAITDPGSALEGFYRKYGFRKVFLNQPDVGGRFSALSFFGLVPAAVAGVDIEKLLEYAGRTEEVSQPSVAAGKNPGLRLGAALGSLARDGRDKVTFVLSGEFSTFGLWIEQLLAESTGKEGKGIVPVTGEGLAGPDSYGNDRVFVSISVGEEDGATADSLARLAKAGHPVIKFHLKDVYALGGEFFRWEIATAAAGAVLGINPFDQPDVELAKKLARERLDAIEEKGAPPQAPDVTAEEGGLKVGFPQGTMKRLKASPDFNPKDLKRSVKDFLGLVGKNDYIGLLAYFDPFDPELSPVLDELRSTLRDSTGAAVQFGFGPRYLHSTGQLHKGEAAKGVFIILTHGTPTELEIPGSSFGFSAIELSQAYGDMAALDSKGLRVMLLDLEDSSAGSVRKAAEVIKGALTALKL